MGNFICAVVILSLVVIFTGVNSIIICDICDDMISLAEAENFDELSHIWGQSRGYLSLFIRDAEIDVVDAEIKKVESEVPFEDAEAATDIISLKDAILELRYSESISWLCIF